MTDDDVIKIRELTDNERRILLGAALETLAERSIYLEQVNAAFVAEDPDYADVGIAVPGEMPRLGCRDRFLPVDIEEIGEDEQLLGQVWIPLKEGYICGIEYSDYAEDRAILPHVSSLRFSPVDPEDRMIHKLTF